jgi:hypothetical protein
MKVTHWNSDDRENKKPRAATCEAGDIAGVIDEGDFRTILLPGPHSIRVVESVEEIEKLRAKK